jgi:hypothetical protein
MQGLLYPPLNSQKYKSHRAYYGKTEKSILQDAGNHGNHLNL